MTESDLSEIVLYHGSLAELNSRDSHKLYTFASELSILVKVKSLHDSTLSRVEDVVRVALTDKNYAGIVNRKTTFRPLKNSVSYIEGTPVVRAE